MEACAMASKNPLHKKIVDQITAVDNFVAFKKLMNKRNTELNEQAIKMMQRKEQIKTGGGITNDMMIPPAEVMTEEMKQKEEAMIRQAMEMSL